MNPFQALLKFFGLGKPEKPKTIALETFGDTITEKPQPSLDAYYEVWKSHGLVFAAIETICQNVTMTGYTIYSNNEQAKEEIENFIEQTGLIDNVMVQLVRNALLFGDGFAENIFDDKGFLVELLPRDPRTIEIIGDKYGRKIGYSQPLVLGESKIIPIQKITHLQFFSCPDSFRGLSLIAPAFDIIQMKKMVDESTAAAVKRHGHPKYDIILKGFLEAGQYTMDEQVFEKIKNTFKNLDAQHEIFHPDSIEIKNIDVKGVENVEEYFNYFTQLLTAALMVPEECLGLGRNVTEATAHTKIVMFERFISMLQNKVAHTLETQVFPYVIGNKYGENVRVAIKFKGITEKDEAVKARWLASLMSVYKGEEKPFSIDEIRAMFGYPPLEKPNENGEKGANKSVKLRQS